MVESLWSKSCCTPPNRINGCILQAPLPPEREEKKVVEQHRDADADVDADVDHRQDNRGCLSSRYPISIADSILSVSKRNKKKVSSVCCIAFG